MTETDKAAEEACLAVVRKAFGDSHAILGEEGGLSGDPSSDYLWCIDPLDGTTNFAHGYPSFAVSVGVLRHAMPVAACVVEFAGWAGLMGVGMHTDVLIIILLIATLLIALAIHYNTRHYCCHSLQHFSLPHNTPTSPTIPLHTPHNPPTHSPQSPYTLPPGGPGTWVTRTYTATRNGGAFLNGTPLCVSRTKSLDQSLLVTDWPSPVPDELRIEVRVVVGFCMFCVVLVCC